MTNTPAMHYSRLLHSGRAVTVVSPHHDDAALSLGAHISHLAADGVHVTLLNCFTVTSYAPFASTEAHTVNQVGAIREAEDAEFCSRAGPSVSSVSLGMLDSLLRMGTEDLDCVLTHRPLDDDDVVALEQLRVQLVRRCPAEPVLVPLAIGSHIDHRLASLAAVLSLRRQIAAFYEDLPYAMRGPAVATDRAVSFCERLIAEKLTPVTLLPSYSPDSKRNLLEAYRSQLCDEDVALSVQGPVGGERLWIPRSLLGAS